MRPRRIRRGMRPFGWCWTACTGFNEAPANSPGNGAPRGDRPVQGMASMRPRRIRRGGMARRYLVCISSRSFNEAPANSPGNARASPGRYSISSQLGFNEAPANSPGNARRSKRLNFGMGRAGLRALPPSRRASGGSGWFGLLGCQRAHVSQCVTAFRALPGKPRALERSRGGRQARRRLARR